MIQTTENVGLFKPDSTDFFKISHQNENMDKIDEELGKKITFPAGGSAGQILKLGTDGSAKWENEAYLLFDGEFAGSSISFPVDPNGKYFYHGATASIQDPPPCSGMTNYYYGTVKMMYLRIRITFCTDIGSNGISDTSVTCRETLLALSEYDRYCLTYAGCNGKVIMNEFTANDDLFDNHRNIYPEEVNGKWVENRGYISLRLKRSAKTSSCCSSSCCSSPCCSSPCCSSSCCSSPCCSAGNMGLNVSNYGGAKLLRLEIL